MYPPTKFPLPKPSFPFPVPPITEDPDAGTQWCVQFNEAYLPAIIGALTQLTLQSTWDTATDDDNLLAQNRAMTLISLFQVGSDCMSGIQFRPCSSPECGLEYSLDGGDTWTCIDLAECISNIWDEKLAGAFDDGVLSKGTPQAGPQSPPEPQTCRTYHVRLNGRDRWHCPSPLQGGDTLHVSNISGGWWDGDTIRGLWSCGDGKIYALGNCIADYPYQSGDPLHEGNHMQVVGNIGALWFNPILYTYAIPDGTPQTDCFLQANDGALTDNQGEIEFDAEVCTANVFDTRDIVVAPSGYGTRIDHPQVMTWRYSGHVYSPGLSYLRVADSLNRTFTIQSLNEHVPCGPVHCDCTMPDNSIQSFGYIPLNFLIKAIYINFNCESTLFGMTFADHVV